MLLNTWFLCEGFAVQTARLWLVCSVNELMLFQTALQHEAFSTACAGEGQINFVHCFLVHSEVR